MEVLVSLLLFGTILLGALSSANNAFYHSQTAYYTSVAIAQAQNIALDIQASQGRDLGAIQAARAVQLAVQLPAGQLALDPAPPQVQISITWQSARQTHQIHYVTRYAEVK